MWQRFLLLLLFLPQLVSSSLVKPQRRVFQIAEGPYFLSRYRVPWYNALAICRSFELEMVTFKTQKDFTNFVKFLEKISPAFVEHETRIWMGGYFNVNSWRWLPQMDKMKYTNWKDTPAPTRNDDPEGYCPRTTFKIWDSYSCSKWHYFVCQMKQDKNEEHW